MDEKKREEIALFRYGLIIPFLAPEELEWGVKGELLKRMVKQTLSVPFSRKNSLGESTIRCYLKGYREKGFDGLKPKSRSDIGKSQNIPSDVLDKAFLLKREEPRRSAKKIIQIMEAHQMVEPGIIKSSTLYRIFKQHDLTAKQLKNTTKSFRSFQAEHPNQIWQSDVMYGPYLPGPDRPEAKKRTYLVALIDDFSRLVPHAEFYWHERLPHLENTLQKAILKRGIPEVLYVDNGQIFNAHQINTICAELGIRKITCQPYSPEGKGKIERFFRTVRQRFLVELQHEKVEHLHQLNNKFWAWLEQEYQQNSHSVTNETPNLRWRQQITPFLRKIEEKQLQAIFLWRENRKVNKLGQVSLQGLSFEVDSFLVGKTVEIRYNHFDLAQVLIYLNGQFIQKATQASLKRWNTASKLPRSGEQKTAKPPASGIKHLTHLEKQHQQQKVQQAKNLLGCSNPTQPPFTSAHFFKAVATVLNRKVENLHVNELQALQQAWNAYGPFHPTFIHTALAKAIIAKGYHQHIDFYLNYIVQSHLKYQNHNQQENQHE
jgi:putative transposase